LLSLAAFVAGTVNSVAGGGTLLTFPTLLAVMGAVNANATSTVGLIPAAVSSAWAYRTELSAMKNMLARLWVPSLLGGSVGALAVTRFPESVFEAMIPWLLVTASTLLLLQKPVARWAGRQHHDAPSRLSVAGIIVFQFLVGCYGGYFGAGIGILMLTALGLMGVENIHEMNALKVILAGVINGITVAIFVAEGVVVWKYALVMALCSLIGGYFGARVARRTPAGVVRAIVVAVGFSIAGFSFYRRFAS
jgi:uncharacterized protein